MATKNVNTTDSEETEIEYFTCNFCKFSTKDLEELDEHVVVSHEEQYLKDGTTENESRPQIEYTIVPDDAPAKKTMQNQDDTICFYNKESRNPKRYKINECSSDVEDTESIYVCPYCDLQTSKRNFMPVHIQTEHVKHGGQIYQCAECTYQTRRKHDMPKHLLTHCSEGSVEMFQCPYCTYQTKRKNDLPKHMLCHESGTDLFTCPHCDYSTKRQGDLMKHSLVHRKFGMNSRAHKRKAVFQRLHHCTECGYTARRLNDLHRHVILHSDGEMDGIYKCGRCKYTTTMSNSFAKHVLNSCRENFEGDVNEVGEAQTLGGCSVTVEIQEQVNEDPLMITQEDLIEEHHIHNVENVEIVEIPQ